jgi:hypothetical protein
LKGLDTISARGISRAEASVIEAEMPTSGPGRQPTIRARKSSPLKKNVLVLVKKTPMPMMNARNGRTN